MTSKSHFNGVFLRAQVDEVGAIEFVATNDTYLSQIESSHFMGKPEQMDTYLQVEAAAAV